MLRMQRICEGVFHVCSSRATDFTSGSRARISSRHGALARLLPRSCRTKKLMVPRNSSSAVEKETLHVWLVDDSHDYRSLMALYLDGERGFHCSRQFDSAETLLAALADGIAPDVILLDVNLNGMSGLDAIRPIRALAQSTPVIMLTTFQDEYSRTRAFAGGAADFLLKTASLAELPRRIRSAWEQSRVGSTIHEWEQVSVESYLDGNKCAHEPDAGVSEVEPRELARDSQGPGSYWRCASRRLVRSMSYLRVWLHL